MTDMRKCDLCDQVLPMAARWWFVTQGKAQPSEWSLPQHWCDNCMTFLKDQHVA